MNIESELPEDFESLSEERKIEELENLKQDLDTGTDSGALKKRIIEELIENYR